MILFFQVYMIVVYMGLSVVRGKKIFSEVFLLFSVTPDITSSRG